MKVQELTVEELTLEKSNQVTRFDEHHVLHDLKHYLPAQAPLKDFIHHNTLHAFQYLKFFEGLHQASEIFGYKSSLSLQEYRDLYTKNKISKDILNRILADKGKDVSEWVNKLVNVDYRNGTLPRIGMLRANWKKSYKIDLDSMVHPILFRILCSFLDQGIAIWSFPDNRKNFLQAIRDMESNATSSFFRTKRAKELLLKSSCELHDLLKVVVGDESLYEQYIYDQQFAHQGWSGMVSTIESQPETLLDRRDITIKDLIVFELLLEIDALDYSFGSKWQPLSYKITEKPTPLFAPVVKTELQEVMTLWQEAYEWTYYDNVLAGLITPRKSPLKFATKTFQAMFCIDDRECSFRRYLEKFDHKCETFGTPGFFGVEFFYQPEDGKFYTKLCPAPVTPKYLIKEVGSKKKREKDLHLSKHSHSFYSGWLISQTLGFWSALKLFINIFRPSMGPATSSSFSHMDKFAKLTIQNTSAEQKENGLQIGFTIPEMAIRVENLLKSVGLVKDFAPIVYLIGHGASSVNNPHYAAYDCGACSGRAGSVNSRVMSDMANNASVREILASHGIVIPPTTQFVGGIHDTTRDEVMFFDEEILIQENLKQHQVNEKIFEKALDANSKERSRRFELIDSKLSPAEIHKTVLLRSVSLFEPRPELNHATNALCIVGRRDLTKGLFMDRRSFLNSFDYKIDPNGDILFNIMRPLGPVCGGINLEYFFSRVDNSKLGAGTKLPHNVMGLVGVANGIDGDLRPGLPSQMIEVHDPIRLLLIVEHFPEVVLNTIQRSKEVYEWFINEWVHLVAVNPETRQLYFFKEGAFKEYHPFKRQVEAIKDFVPIIEATQENLPVYLIAEETL